MVTCTNLFYCEDQDGDPIGSWVQIYELRTEWVWLTNVWTDSSSGVTAELTVGKKYKAIPGPPVGIRDDYVVPKEIRWTACLKDITLVYEKIICTPNDVKCIGDDVYKCNSVGTEWNFSKSCPGGCKDGDCIAPTVGNGFTIHVATALATKTILVVHVVKLPSYGLPGVDPGPDIYYWPEILGFVGGEWHMVDPSTTYIAQVGSIQETIPSFDKTFGTGSFADGIDCVVMALGTSGVGTLLFKEEDVFRLNKDIPTEIWLSTTSNDIISEAFMGPVCDIFGIERGDQCKMFWAEMYDPMFLANYTCIKNTGKDLLGNDREITLFDKIAVPFAILGSMPGLSLLPFGAFVTKGLKTADMFSDAAVKFMLNFSMDVSGKISTKDTWYFLDAIRQVTKTHADEIVKALTDGDTTLADSLLRQYAGESKGWWDYRTLDGLLKDALPTDAYNWLRTQIGLPEIGSGTIINTAKQVPPLAADDVAKLANAALDPVVMDDVTALVYDSLKTLDNIDIPSLKIEKLNKLKNILKNSPEISAKLIEKHLSILDHVMYTGGDITREEISAIFVHGVADPETIAVDIIHALSTSEYIDDAGHGGGTCLNELIRRFDDGTYRQTLADTFSIVDDYIAELGSSAKKSWIADYCMIGRESLKASNPAATSGVVKTAQEYTTSYKNVAAYMGVSIVYDIIDNTESFAETAVTDRIETGKQIVANTSDKFWNYYDSLSDAGKENIVHEMVGSTIVFSVTPFNTLYNDAGPETLNQNLFTSKMDTWYWPCSHACENSDASTLGDAIKVYEKVINECAESLSDNETSLKNGGLYYEFNRTLQLHQFNISRMEYCLEQLQSTTPTPMHTISIVVPAGSTLYVDGGSVRGTTAVSRLSAIYDGMRKR